MFYQVQYGKEFVERHSNSLVNVFVLWNFVLIASPYIFHLEWTDRRSTKSFTYSRIVLISHLFILSAYILTLLILFWVSVGYSLYREKTEERKRTLIVLCLSPRSWLISLSMFLWLGVKVTRKNNCTDWTGSESDEAYSFCMIWAENPNNFNNKTKATTGH